MKVTVCQLSDDFIEFKKEWELLKDHLRINQPALLLLPEMPFSPWFGNQKRFNAKVWNAAVADHENWISSLQGSRFWTLGTKPVNRGKKRFNAGFCVDLSGKTRMTHFKHYIPNEYPVYESSWYERGSKKFDVFNIGTTKAGFLICTELWFLQHARQLGRASADLILTPRKTGVENIEKWLSAGRVAALVSGAFSLSSNSWGGESCFGGTGWVIGPEGDLLGKTSEHEPFVTVDIDLKTAKLAKKRYPRNVRE